VGPTGNGSIWQTTGQLGLKSYCHVPSHGSGLGASVTLDPVSRELSRCNQAPAQLPSYGQARKLTEISAQFGCVLTYQEEFL
tara:strand:- start:453 stop:698 length:246 start_codon:yes stop_codon:yes gene_type:complete